VRRRWPSSAGARGHGLEDEVDGATAEISGATVFDSSAVASDIVRVTPSEAGAQARARRRASRRDRENVGPERGDLRADLCLRSFPRPTVRMTEQCRSGSEHGQRERRRWCGPPRDRCGASRASSPRCLERARAAPAIPHRSASLCWAIGSSTRPSRIWITVRHSPHARVMVMRTRSSGTVELFERASTSRADVESRLRRLVRQISAGSVTRLSPPPPAVAGHPRALRACGGHDQTVDALERCHRPFPALHSATPA